jgi:hypothetical protein
VTTSLGAPAGIGALALAEGEVEVVGEGLGDVGLGEVDAEPGVEVLVGVDPVAPSSSGSPHPTRAQVRASASRAGDVR